MPGAKTLNDKCVSNINKVSGILKKGCTTLTGFFRFRNLSKPKRNS